MKTLWRALAALVMVGGLAAVMGCGDTGTATPKKDDAKPAATPEKKA